MAKIFMGTVKVDWTRSCRVCLAPRRPMVNLFNFQSGHNYAEMLTSIANVQMSAKDGYPDKICHKCSTFLIKAVKFKKIAEMSDRRLRESMKRKEAPAKKIAFDSFRDIKSEMDSLNIKKEPSIQVEIEVLSSSEGIENPMDSIKGKDIVIGGTVIRKVDAANEDRKPAKPDFSDAEITWKKVGKEEPNDDDGEVEYLDDDFLNNDNDSDEDYIPLAETAKLKKVKKEKKFKMPKLAEVKVFKENKKNSANKPTRVLKMALNRATSSTIPKIASAPGQEKKSTFITCYPLLSNGKRGPPVLLKRPKDATILKVHPNYKPRIMMNRDSTVTKRERVETRPAIVKPREKHVCPICGILTFGLGNHMATHAEKKRYSCAECTRTFAQKNNLDIHMKSHNGIKDNICEICGAGFYSQRSLLRHNLIHKGERPFGCTLCTKRFIARCDLTRHLKIHSGYKPFKCNTCTMSFNAKHQLQNHERMHTGEKPYSCEVCHVAFSYKVNLNNHVFKVHGINLKFKSIHTITEEVLRKEHELLNEARSAIIHIMPQMSADQVPQPGAHETLSSSHMDDMKVHYV